MRHSPLEKKAAKMRMGAWLLLLSVLILSLWVSFALIEEQPANPANDWLNDEWAEPLPAGVELRIARSLDKDNQVEGYETISKSVEPDSELPPQYGCSKKFQHCPTRD